MTGSSLTNEVPTVIGRYDIVRLLGETHFGSEYLASFSTAGGMPNAARLLVIGDPLKSNAATAFALLEPVLSLTHGALVRPIDAGSADGFAYVAFEYQPARDLASVEAVHRIRIGPLPLASTLYIVTQLLGGLRYAARQVRTGAPPTHGRIGPETVLLLSDGQVKLHQLGLAPAFGLEPTSLSMDLPKPPTLEAADAQAVALLGRALIADRAVEGEGSDERAVRDALLAGPLSMTQIAAIVDASVLMESLSTAQHELAVQVQAENLAELLDTLFHAELARDDEELSKILAEVRVRSGTIDLMALDRPRSGTMNLDADDTIDSADAAPGTPPPESVIAGKYRVIRMLGRGGMGNVMEVEHLDLGRRGALKLLHPQLSYDRTFAERFRREARAACKIGHRNIVDVFDFGRTDDGRLFYVMELISGGSLQDQIEAIGAFDQIRAVRILLQVCDALDAAHEVSVVHRDLKPDNVMLSVADDGTEIVRVVDFGIAQDGTSTSARVTKTGQIFGTPAYMSPEQVRGLTTDHRSDIYSAGTILYELLTGHHVFESDTVIDVMSSHLKHTPVPPSVCAPERDIHPLLDDVIAHSLEKDPKDRYQSMADMAFDLWTVLERIREESAASGIRAAIPETRPPRVLRQVVRDVFDTPGLHDVDAPLIASEGRAPAATPVPGPEAPPERAALDLERERIAVPVYPAFDEPDSEHHRRGSFAVVLVVALVVTAAGGAYVLFRGGGGGLSSLFRSESAPTALVTEPGPEADATVVADAGGPAPTDVDSDATDEEDVADAGSKGGRPRRRHGASAATQSKLLEEAQQAMRERRPAEAARIYNRILGRSPSNAAALAGLGQAEFELGHYAAAAGHIRRAVQINPSNNRYRLLLAGALHRAGQSADARRQYEEVLRRDPGNAVAKRMLQR
jgi:serine/threonine protein kinase